VSLRALAAALALLALAGCGGPEPPDPELGGMEPQVAELLEGARRVAVERDSAEAWGSLGSAYDAHGLLAEAEVCYRHAATLDPGAFVWTYLLAVVREVQGAEAAEVVQLFDRAGTALSLRGEHARAREAFERAIALAPRDAVAQRGLGHVLLALGDAAAAAEHLSRAIELQPKDLAAHAGLAQAHMRLGQVERARAIAERARGLEPIDALADPVYGERVFMRSVGSSRAFARAMAALRIEAWAQAVADLELVLRARPDDASVHYWKGVAHRRLSQSVPALTHLSRAVELSPGMVPARLQLAALLLEEGRHAEAVVQYERAAALEPLDAESRQALSRARNPD
jgi:tetratricopeptide (TPR) repeat protein